MKGKVRKPLFQLLIVLFTLFGLIGLLAGDKTESGQIAIKTLFGIAGVLLVLQITLDKKIKNEQKAIQAEKDNEEALHLGQQIEAIRRGELPIIHNTPVILAPGEVAHLSLNATRLITKNKAVGRTGGGSGVSFRVAKGVSVRTGGGASKTIYEDVTSTYKGMLIVTNQRIIFINSQQGFEHKLSSVSSLFVDKANVELQVKSKSYTFIVAGAAILQTVIHALTNGSNNRESQQGYINQEF